ncbi:hypothetical protein CLAFUW4_07794 [Fulvia fulva]|uniref:Uncharacterized protein n=1 Tax=Passalora fulva TaxID=5499 RepID=A0A9Q8LF52_PASFU|nr:uncharacterized protein CLAFUR5_07919 [Fulvia fulva]KAK4629641.1 hypothetical protein CLAFUR4_07799 [Fulvia fulva]KAK4630561.1 hypothetical protein CLAFUR0_07796 [Fulvia fulva]UJO15548.1 hypothetical protein CLAFUR5_07919 [Fulvia fulva]WPV12046.1 hypothetical protein CLAFUW4_07794 [Fulvia fulva]WPV27873.1 hypothetical protein CLAFUW7_07795 [Fulvia fulva]
MALNPPADRQEIVKRGPLCGDPRRGEKEDALAPLHTRQLVHQLHQDLRPNLNDQHPLRDRVLAVVPDFTIEVCSVLGQLYAHTPQIAVPAETMAHKDAGIDWEAEFQYLNGAAHKRAPVVA